MVKVVANHPVELLGFTIDVTPTELEWLVSLTGVVDATNKECFDLFQVLCNALEGVGLYNYARSRKLRKGLIPE